MSAKEKLNGLIEEAKQAKQAEADLKRAQEQLQFQQRHAQVQEDNEERNKRQQLYKDGLPRAMRDQVKLFNDLENVGLVAAITDITGRRFFKPQVPAVRKDGQSSKIHFPSKEAVRERLNDNGWRVKVDEAVMDPDGVWLRGILDLNIFKVDMDYGSRFQAEIRSIESVGIHYTKSHALVIAGAEETFNNLIDPDQPTPEQTDSLETALALAVYRPKIEDHSHRAKEQARIQTAIDLLKTEYGDNFGQAIGSFIYGSSSDQFSQVRVALARESVDLLEGIKDEKVRAIEGLLTAIGGNFHNRLDPIASQARSAALHTMRF